MEPIPPPLPLKGAVLVPVGTDQKGGRVKSLEPSVVEPAGGFAHTMSKPQGGGLDAENHGVEGRNPVLSIVNDV